ncbi:7-cyano-7-deazaguanine synthase QueC [Paraliomyxa miuraensis]|uniref:7-cyano-7-deazaguanine synthase QueC n=1 Tax=Paraliomyxa miuraensis TaxID=376150 RepID=UPI002257605B|nr:7-cyano-7-deazaguanine synthase QueC [Paraliomyxa miuraensis]MCX4247575.1 7-cyano-7-deazaguanine synthase QueC [Paraliomyxa miuraensis]
MSDARDEGATGPAVVLLSGGLDSVTVLAIARAAGHDVYALSFRYGQRHALELQCAARQAERFGARAHELVDLSHLGRLVASATALVEGSALSVPKDRDPSGAGAAAEHASEIPVTYVPARNTLFLSYALAWAETLGARDIWIGVNALDYSGYPDCRPAFIDAFARMANLATRVGVEGEGDAVRIRTPLIDLPKSGIIARGVELGVNYADTVSCYDPSADEPDQRRAWPLACGRCDSCQLRRKGFAEAGVEDPTRYVAG